MAMSYAKVKTLIRLQEGRSCACVISHATSKDARNTP
ncbi:MAG: hypothetical protein ACLTZI_09300 [[Eubacterium] siraeum]